MPSFKTHAARGVSWLACAACSGATQVGLLEPDGGEMAETSSSHDGAPHGHGSGDGSPRDSRGDAAPVDARAESAPTDTGPPCSALCVPPVPGGWEGPEELSETTSAPPSCGSSFAPGPAFDGHDVLTGDSAECSTCTCGDPMGVACSPHVSATFYKDSACSMPCGSAAVNLPSYKCTDVTGALLSCSISTLGNFVSITGASVVTGSCAPSPETPTLPAVSWGESGRACAPASPPAPSGCSSGDLCVPERDPGFAAYCVRRSGDHDCPKSGYTVKHVLYDGFTDTRSCTDCTCGSVSDDACDMSSVGAYGGACSIFSTSDYTPLPTACASVGLGVMRMSYAPVASGGSCTHHGGSPKGSVRPAKPTTFCCTP